MANIKKSFNFRNGVQVDSDNLLVTSTGLVGIGTTVPSESLDVIGNVSISGLTSTSEATIGVLTVTSVKPTEIIGAGVSIKSGIITSSGGGVVTFFGDGSNLTNLPTSQFSTVGGGSTNVFVIPNVGIATTNPSFNLQIGNDVDSGGKGVGINSLGDVKASGIITATGFVGNVSGNLTGNVTGNVTGNLTGDINSGVSTFNDDVNFVGDPVGTALTSIQFHKGDGTNSDVDALRFYDSAAIDFGVGNTGNMRLRGNFGNSSFILAYGDNLFIDGSSFGNTTIKIRTRDARNGIVVNPDTTSGTVELYHSSGGTATKRLETSGVGATVYGQLDTTNLSVSGASTFGGNVDINADLDVDGHTNLDNVNIAGVTTTAGIIEGISGENKIPALYSNMGALPNPGTYHGMFAHVHATGRGYFSHAGGWHELVNKETNGRVGTGTEVYNIGNINSSGIITATTELNSPLIGVGTDVPANDIQVRKSGNTEIQVTSDTGSAGITVGREPSTGNTNNAEFRYGLVSGGAPYSSAQSLDILNYGTGNFNYHISANNAGAIAGDFHWHKSLNNTLMTLTGIGGSLGIGITTPSEELHVIGGAIISGNLTANNLIGNLNGTLTGDVNITSGISTFKDLKVTGNTTIGSGNETVFVNELGEVGIKTTSSLTNVTINASQVSASIKSVAIGATVLKSAVDFADAGNLSKRFMIPPKVGAAQTASLSGLVSGAMIYNTNLNKLQVYNGTNWETITSVEVTG